MYVVKTYVPVPIGIGNDGVVYLTLAKLQDYHEGQVLSESLKVTSVNYPSFETYEDCDEYCFRHNEEAYKKYKGWL